MKRFIVQSLAFGAIVFITLVAACFFLPDAGIKNTDLGVELHKRERLKSLPGRRIVFIGGSTVSFGIDSEIVEKEFNRPVVNMGLHGGLGICYNMASALPFLRRGDDVFMLIEYEHFTGNHCYGQLEALATLVDIVPWGEISLSAPHKCHLAQFIIQYGAKKIKNIRKIIMKGADETRWFNTAGDAIICRNDPEQCKIKGRHYKPFSVRKLAPICMDEIRSFISVCKDRGVHVIVMPPNTVNELIDKKFEEAWAEMLDKNKIPYVGLPRRYAFPVDCFYDTSYHLNNQGRTLAMALRVEDMRKAFTLWKKEDKE